MSAPRLALALALALAGCSDVGPTPAPPAVSTSPNASILPAPLATGSPDLDGGAKITPRPRPATDAGLDGSAPRLADAGAPPAALEPFAQPPADELEAREPRELLGVTLEAVLRMRDLPPATKGEGVSAEGVREATRALALSVSLDVADLGRARLRVTSRAMPLPPSSEIRARSDRLGYAVVWPKRDRYRVLSHGGLRALLGERRFDVTPLGAATFHEGADGKRLGFTTHTVRATGPYGELALEVGAVPEAGEGGPLVCRMLFELAGIDPLAPVTNAPCEPGEVPLYAAFTWLGGAGLTFDVTSVTRRENLAAGDLALPPPSAAFATVGLPEHDSGVFLSDHELAALRSPQHGGPPPGPGAPAGLFVENRGDVPRWITLDGLPVAWVPAAGEREIRALPKGRYALQLRSFLGDTVGVAQSVDVPARVTPDAADAGAPDGG